jgi:tetratricopeptide (TPR) repeat protein
MRVEATDASVKIHVQAMSELSNCIVRVVDDGREVGRWQGDLHPEHPLHEEFAMSGASGALEVTVEQDGCAVLHYAPAEIVPVAAPTVATEPEMPEDVATIDELYLNGLHLEQYRHPTRAPEVYWQEALRRDAGDSRCNHALGRWHLRRGEFEKAEHYLREAIARLTMRNPNPPDGEPHYNLGLVLLYQERVAEAYEAFYKSTWNAAWRGPGYQRLAEIDCARKDWAAALDHLDRSLRAEAENLNARNLKTIVLRKLGHEVAAAEVLNETWALDPLDIFSRWLDGDEIPQDGHQRLDLAFDLMRAGLLEDALSILSAPLLRKQDGSGALLLYVQADVLRRLGRGSDSKEIYIRAAAADPIYVFPYGLESMVALERAIHANPSDARAPYYLGNLFYDRRRYREAIELWERATALDPSFPTAWRNLGFGYYNVLHDAPRAIRAFEQARATAPKDARILYEQDQLLKRTGVSIDYRLAALEAQRDLVDRRDDLSVELASLYNSTTQPARALSILLERQFQPWEGGEGLVLSQYVRANVLLAVSALHDGDSLHALTLLQAAWNPPRNLSEAKHLLMNLSMIDYWLGVAYFEHRETARANTHWAHAARQKGDFQQMQVQPVSEMTYWSAMALRRLGWESEAQALFHKIFDYAQELEQRTPAIDYFATSLPAMLLFSEDLKTRETVTARFLQAQALLGLGKEAEGRELLQQLRALDSSHNGAIDLLRISEG